ncbi:hypothetical protein ACWN97_09140 [Pediococcus acidilactici]
MKEFADKIKKRIDLFYEKMEKWGEILAEKWVYIIGTLLIWPIIFAFLLELSKVIHIYGKEFMAKLLQFKMMGDNIGLFMNAAYGLSFIIIIGYLAFLVEIFADKITQDWKNINFVVSFVIIFIALYFDSGKSKDWYGFIVFFGSICLSVLVIEGLVALISWFRTKVSENIEKLSKYLSKNPNIQGTLIAAVFGTFGTIIAAILK